MIINSSTGFGYVTSNGKVIQKLVCPANEDVIAQDGTWTDVANQTELDEVKLFQYDSNDLIEYGMQTYPSLIGTAHEYVLTTFASKPRSFKSLMLQRASLLDSQLGDTTFTDIANDLISKAIELGADIEEV